MTRDTGPAKLPSLPPTNIQDPALRNWMQAVAERLEVREGTRGNPFERTVLVRELIDLKLASATGGGRGLTRLIGGPDAPGGFAGPGTSAEAFSASVFNSRLFQNLVKRLDDPTRFDALPEQVRTILLQNIADEASKRGADIRRLEEKIQTATNSLAYTVQEVTASVEQSAAGVRELTFASATPDTAMAGKITQLEASLGNYYADGTPGRASLEQQMTVTADRTTGLAAEYMVKLNAGRAVAGFGLAATEDPGGATSSSFIVQADKFALTTPYNFAQASTPSAAASGQTWYNSTSKLSYRSTAAGMGSWALFTPAVPFGVDTTTGQVFINGSLRINAGGAALQDSVSGAPGTSTAIVYAYKRSATDLATGWNPTTNGPGAVTWTFASGAITTPATNALLNGWTKTIPSGADGLYTTVCTAANTTATDTLANTEWATPALIALTGSDGIDGLSVATALLYQRTAIPTAPSVQANTVTYTFATGGMTGMSAGWTDAIPSAASGAFLWVTRATASSITPTDALLAAEWSAPVIYTQDGTDGGTGDSVDIVFVRSASQPATPTESASAPTAPILWYSNPGSVPASNNPLWSSVGKKTTGDYTWSTPVRIDGTAVAEVTAFIRSPSMPSTPSGGTYTFSTTPALSPPASWSATIPAGTDSVYLSRAVVSAPSGVTSAISIAGWTSPVLSLQNGPPGAVGAQGLTGSQGLQGSPGSPGPNGLNGAAYVTAASFKSSASAAGTEIGLSTVFNARMGRMPQVGDAITLHNQSSRWSQTWVRLESSWSAATLFIDGNAVITGTLFANTISTQKVVISPIGAYIANSLPITSGGVTFTLTTSSAVVTPLWSHAIDAPSGVLCTVAWINSTGTSCTFAIRAILANTAAPYTGTIPTIKIWMF